jgi:hypothetical protein
MRGDGGAEGGGDDVIINAVLGELPLARINAFNWATLIQLVPRNWAEFSFTKASLKC